MSHQDARFHAETTYAMWCLFNPSGSYPGVEGVREELRDDLNTLSRCSNAFRPHDRKERRKKMLSLKKDKQEGEVVVTPDEKNKVNNSAARVEEDEDAASVGRKVNV